MKTSLRFLLLSLSLLIFTAQNLTHASDLAKEQRWADQIVDGIMDGEAIWLNADNTEFLGIHTETDEDSNRAIILMHGTGAHPDWPQIIQTLRVALIESNWQTLSIQMPILANDAAYEDYAPLYSEVAPRINAAIKKLKQSGVNHIVLLGHSQGSTMGAYFLKHASRHPEDSPNSDLLKGFIAIGMSATMSNDVRMNSAISLEDIKIPVLDLYGSEDLDTVLDTVEERAEAAKTAGNKSYTQIKIDNANHFFDDQENALVKTVSDWLAKSLK